MNAPNITILKTSTYRYGIYFHVLGETGKKYIVDYNFNKGWICDCPNHLFRKVFCKHMRACRDYAESKGLMLADDVWWDNPKSEIIIKKEVLV